MNDHPPASSDDYVPVLRYRALTPVFDLALRVFTREARWRDATLNALSLSAGERVLDIGCGTGSLCVLLKQTCPGAEIFGVDPDPDILVRAREKAAAADRSVGFVNAMGDALEEHWAPASLDAIVTTLVLHQVPYEGKASILRAAYGALKPGGRLVVTDYGKQDGLMRLAFRVSIQMLDGFQLTEPNAKGCLPDLMAEVGFTALSDQPVIKTPTGAVRVHSGVKPTTR